MDKRKIYGKMVCANLGIRTALVPIQLSVENLNNTRQALTSKALGQSCAPWAVPGEGRGSSQLGTGPYQQYGSTFTFVLANIYTLGHGN